MTPQERHFAADLAAAADKHQREVDRLRSQLRDRDAALNAVNDALAVRDGLPSFTAAAACKFASSSGGAPLRVAPHACTGHAGEGGGCCPVSGDQWARGRPASRLGPFVAGEMGGNRSQAYIPPLRRQHAISFGHPVATMCHPMVTLRLEQELADLKDQLADAQARNAVLAADNATANRLLEESKVRAGFEQLAGRLLVSIFHFLCLGVPLYTGELLR
jgi:hypothetical protein